MTGHLTGHISLLSTLLLAGCGGSQTASTPSAETSASAGGESTDRKAAVALMVPYNQGLSAECDGEPMLTPKRGACDNLFVGLMLASDVSSSDAADYASYRDTCESTGDCTDAVVATFWGLSPLSAPDPDAALAFAKSSCAKGNDLGCSLAQVVDAVRRRVAASQP